MMTDNKKAASAGTGTASKITFDGTILAEIQKNQREVYRVVQRRFKAHSLVDVRVWYDDHESGELRPGKGVSLKADCLPAILEALHAANGGQQ